jgi:hypothetical protein
MAEDLTHQSAERHAEAQGRRLPFATIFDTIVVEPAHEPAPESPSSARDYADSAPPHSFDVNRSSSATARGRSGPEQLAGHDSGISNWIVAVGTVMIALTLAYVGLQLRRQTQVLSEQLLQPLLRATQESRQLEQRPWVGIDAVAQPLTAAGSTFNISLQNAGKTPALDVYVSGSVLLQNSPPTGPSDEGAPPVKRYAGTLSPGAVHKVPLEFRLPLASVAALYRNQVFAVLHISVTYKDVFQAAHTTQSCFYWQPSLQDVQACEGYNTVN